MCVGLSIGVVYGFGARDQCRYRAIRRLLVAMQILLRRGRGEIGVLVFYNMQYQVRGAQSTISLLGRKEGAVVVSAEPRAGRADTEGDSGGLIGVLGLGDG